MKKQLLALFAFLLTSLSIYAQNSNEGFYVGGLGGLNLEFFDSCHLKTKPGYSIGGFAGYKFCNNIRTEGEFSYRRNELRKHFHGYREIYTFMGNACYDFDLHCDLTPYIGFGMGYAHERGRIRMKTDSSFRHSHHKFKGNNVAWQTIVGASYQIAYNTDLGVEYRTLFTQEKSYNHLVALSLKQYF